jgi:hypothetical protein
MRRSPTGTRARTTGGGDAQLKKKKLVSAEIDVVVAEIFDDVAPGSPVAPWPRPRYGPSSTPAARLPYDESDGSSARVTVTKATLGLLAPLTTRGS